LNVRSLVAPFHLSTDTKRIPIFALSFHDIASLLESPAILSLADTCHGCALKSTIQGTSLSISLNLTLIVFNVIMLPAALLLLKLQIISLNCHAAAGILSLLDVTTTLAHNGDILRRLPWAWTI